MVINDIFKNVKFAFSSLTIILIMIVTWVMVVWEELGDEYVGPYVCICG